MIVHDKRFYWVVLPNGVDEAVTFVEVNDVEVLNILNEVGKGVGRMFSFLCFIGEVSKEVVPPWIINIGVYPVNSICPLSEGASNSRCVPDMKNAWV